MQGGVTRSVGLGAEGWVRGGEALEALADYRRARGGWLEG